MERFTGKIALITGGSSGIGAACVRQFTEEGATVVLVDRDTDGARTVAKTAPGRIHVVEGDVTHSKTWHTVGGLLHRLGGLDIAVNNAGVLGELAPLHALTADSFRHVVDVNLYGVVHAMRCEIPVMTGSGGGVIINMASVGAVSGFAGASPYCAAKHAVLGLTRSTALEYAEAGIRVVAVAPGLIDTAVADGLPAEQREALLRQLADAQAMKRAGRPEDVAALTCFLASPAASFITGSLYPVDAGYLAR
ncbi:SDR family NAD(P)-dependent oxidoreductase [Streptomyces ortus]|uniref:SDR family oxidoreductase n=1 Tax=Streptomyces ortus TaxID=2867268 RepID=A0ABT3VG30_9ACTN|nr:SDR family NAD(P)-dependent oxidoreductase [Streptomyces ortus]MCX4238856.1 SDR family oxidoreductase [Streptomyces ortus]